MSKRTLDAYLKPARSSATDASSSKKLKETVPSPEDQNPNTEHSKLADTHPSYPFSINALKSHISTALQTTTLARAPKQINNQPHLDLLYYEPFIPRPTADEYFKFLRRELPFYRVKYTIKRGPTETLINTPRYTTVFGVDGTSYFSAKEGNKILLDSKTHKPTPPTKYKCTPRPIPSCLDVLRQHVETRLNDGTSYNFVLVNYYASGDDSISYHSDDERFLGPLPNIASLTLGARRDFLMKHKPVAGSTDTAATTTSKDKPLKLPLGSGDMVIMRGETQSNWLHSIPKRKGGEAGSGRINITLRKAVVPGGTENYYRYNVGEGGLYRWDERGKEMVLTG
jgi:alkylated DNA repair dioxygenase AlkB